jgi:FdhD protein
MAGAGVLTAVSAPTRLAVDLAEQHNLALAGLVREQSFTAYSHPSRLKNLQPFALQA